MINVSNEFKSVVSGQNRTYYGGATITLLDSTILNLDNSKIIGLKIEDAVSQSGQFTIGGAIINKLTLTINNLDDAYSNYDFTDAVIRPTVGLQLSETIETLSKGVFTADDPKAIGSIITLTALDNMSKFDTPFSGVTILFPTTADLLLTAVCTYCGVSLATSTFTNSDFTITTRPLDEAINCREIVAWIAQLSGNFARINNVGQLELKWYDFELFEEETNLDGGTFDNGLIDITKIEGASSQVVTVQGKNLIPYFSNSSLTSMGVAATTDINGNIILNGTATTDVWFDLLPSPLKSPITPRSSYFIKLSNGLPYTAKRTVVSGTVSEPISIVLSDDINSKSTYYILTSSNSYQQTNTPNADIGITRIWCYIPSGTVLANYKFVIQLEQNSAATAYAPFVPNSPSPNYPAPITNANNFDITASNGTDSNSVNIPYEMPALPNGVEDTIEKGTDGITRRIQRAGKSTLTTTTALSDAKPNGYYMSSIGSGNLSGTTYILPSGVSSVTAQYELATPIETVIDNITLTSYGNNTTITTNSNPQVTIETDAYYASGDSADGGNFTNYNSGDTFDGGTFTDLKRFHHIFALNQFSCATDDVVITGISVTDSVETPNTVLFGTTGYVISIEGNKLIQSLADATTIANTVGAKTVGMKFRPCSLTAISDPSREAGDIAYVTDRKQNTYQILLSGVSFGIGSADKISCDAESPSRNSSTRYDETTKAIIEARKYTEKKLNAYDLAIQQMTSLIVHAFGLYKTSEVLPDGSTVFYSHDKPTIAESSFVYQENSNGFFVSNDGGVTWNSGWDSEGNAVFNVLSAIGINAEWINVITTFTVGSKFSVRGSDGKLTASDADLSGKVTATSGKIANINIDNYGLILDSPEVDDYFRIKVGDTIIQMFADAIRQVAPAGFHTSGTDYELQVTKDIIDIHANDGTKIYTINANSGSFDIRCVDLATGSHDNLNLKLNGIPIINDFNNLYTKVSKMETFLITTFGYTP